MQTEGLLRTLADGAPHSGQALARSFGVTRAAIWKQIAKLKDYGLEFEAAAGRGYRLGRPIDFLDLDQITAELKPLVRGRVASLDIFTELDSTNRYLLERGNPEPSRPHICLAEYQYAGRGRRGRSWTAPLGGGLCLSVGWRFGETPKDLSALSLAIGVVVRRSLCELMPIDIGLKWPNDLVFDRRKLGGILVELNAEANGGCYVVAGLGINVAIPARQLQAVSDWPAGAIDLEQASGGALPRRSKLAACLIEQLTDLFDDFAATGFQPYEREWSEAHILTNATVRLEDSSGVRFGTVRGIERDGALVLETDDGTRQRIVAGDLSLRPAP